MTKTIPIYCINLARATERKTKMMRDWVERYGFDIQFFEAFDRRLLPDGAVLPVDQEQSIALLGRPLTAGEIACATSHYLLCKKLVEENVQEAIIMEDDVFPVVSRFKTTDAFFAIVHAAKTAFPNLQALILHKSSDHYCWKNLNNWELIQWGLIQEIKRLIKNLIGMPLGIGKVAAKNQGVLLLRRPPWGCQSVWYNRSGLEKMCKALETLSMPSDHAYLHYFTQDQSVAMLRKPLVTFSSEDSYIENTRFRFLKKRFMP